MSISSLPDSSRVWVFLANRILAPNESMDLQKIIEDFVGKWQTHGADLTAGYEVFGNAALIVAVDESKTPPSGCSIDKVFRLLQDFGAEKSVDFLSRTLVGKLVENTVTIFTKQEAVEAFNSGELKDNTLVIDTLVADLSAYKNNFKIAFKNHWLGKQLIVKNTA